jgi:hypothetical protein
MTQLSDRRSGTTRGTAGPRLLKVTTVLALLAFLWQFWSAGHYVGTKLTSGFGLHVAGAYAVHLTTLLVLVAAFLEMRAQGGAPRWPVVLAGLVFLATFVQAALGHFKAVAVHVPGALVLTIGLVWLTAWAFTPRRAA